MNSKISSIPQKPRRVLRPQANAPAIVDFQPYMGKVRKPGTGCISQINDHLFEGRYSPTWIDGKKHARNVYAHTREECEEKLKVLIAETKAELAELKHGRKRTVVDRMNGTQPSGMLRMAAIVFWPAILL